VGPVQGVRQGRHQALYQRGRHDRARLLRRAHDRLWHLRLLRARTLEEGQQSRHHPAEDYTLITSRVAFISKQAKNPNTAKLFLDYILSKRGQNIIANAADLYTLRSDIDGEATAKRVAELVGDKARPVPISDELLSNLDAKKRLAFIRQWQAAMKGQ